MAPTLVLLLLSASTAWGLPAYQGMPASFSRGVGLVNGDSLQRRSSPDPPRVLFPGNISSYWTQNYLKMPVSLAPESSLYRTLASRDSRPEVLNHLARARALIAHDGNGSVLTSVYSIGHFNGYAAKLSDRYNPYNYSYSGCYIRSQSEGQAEIYDGCLLRGVQSEVPYSAVMCTSDRCYMGKCAGISI